MNDYDEYLHDAPARRTAEDRRAARTMLELRALYPFDPYATQPVSLEARATPTAPFQRVSAWLWRKITR